MKAMVFTASFLVFLACGTDTVREVPVPGYPVPGPAPAPVPPGPSPDPGGPVTWDTIKPLIIEQCGTASCHNGTSILATEDAFRGSRSKSEIISGDMPLRFGPNYGTWDEEKKSKILNFIGP